jgi:hypothetical protein
MIIPSHPINQKAACITSPVISPPDAHDPVIALCNEGDTLSFYFDSGAGSTTLYYPFFEKYKSQIHKDGHVKTIQFAGAGGTTKESIYSSRP